MPSKNIEFIFDELPLAIIDGVEAGFVNGYAGVEYWDSGEWVIRSVSLEGFGPRVNGKRTYPPVEAPEPLLGIIVLRLEREWRSRVQEAVSEELAHDAQCAHDNDADNGSKS